jgi:hypothetical protein
MKQIENPVSFPTVEEIDAELEQHKNRIADLRRLRKAVETINESQKDANGDGK